jgi:adenylate kinase
MSPGFSGLNLVFLGPPGAGKGTQARRLAERFCIPHIATGDLLRDEVRRGTALGQQVEEMVAAGKLVPDPIVNGLVLPRLHADGAARGFILDGYPRNQTQAVTLDGILAELNRSLERVVLFVVDAEAALTRLEVDEDRPVASADRRLEIWRRQTAPLSDIYCKRGLLVEIDAAQAPAEVEAALAHAVAAPVGA